MGAKLEVCVDSVESAVIALKSGADCLEVCANLVIGGTTPGVSQFRQIRKLCDIGLNVLIRPRFGDFLYTDAEFQMMEEDVQMFRELGADGVVAGCLKADGDLDLNRMRALKERAGDMCFTLHRAFDVCRDPYVTLEEAVALGVDRILTSGQAPCCTEGKELLKNLIIQAESRVDILIGSKVDACVIREMIEDIHASSFHMSGKRIISSGMVYRNRNINMGFPGFSEFDILRTDGEEIQKARYVMDEML